jgi:hypothetical protein
MGLIKMSEDLEEIKILLKQANDSVKEIFLPHKQDYSTTPKNFAKSRQQKTNWIIHRFKYQIGINKANRINPYKDLRKSRLIDILKKDK